MTDIAHRLQTMAETLAAGKGKTVEISYTDMLEGAAEIKRLRGDRERRTGAHVLQTAKAMGWLDDGEGALEFLLRRAREVAFEDCGFQPNGAPLSRS